jgi:hypothetical protein
MRADCLCVRVAAPTPTESAVPAGRHYKHEEHRTGDYRHHEEAYAPKHEEAYAPKYYKNAPRRTACEWQWQRLAMIC